MVVVTVVTVEAVVVVVTVVTVVAAVTVVAVDELEAVVAVDELEAVVAVEAVEAKQRHASRMRLFRGVVWLLCRFLISNAPVIFSYVKFLALYDVIIFDIPIQH